MSNRRNRKQQVNGSPEGANSVHDEAAQPATDATESKPQRRDDVKPHLRCPCCWNNYGGKAARRKWQRQVSGPLVQRCYVCDQCGAEWVVDVRVEEQDGVEWVETKVSQVRQTA